MDPAVLEISPLFLGFVDDDVVPFFFCFPSLITSSSTLYVSYSTYLASSATFWVCNYDATLCYCFCYCYDIECFYNTSYLFIAYS